MKKNANNSFDKRCARAAYQALHMWRSDFPQDIHKLILSVGVAMEAIHARTAKKYIELIACSIKIGHFAGLNGKTDFKAQPGSWFTKRWRCVSKKAVRTGISLATAK